MPSNLGIDISSVNINVTWPPIVGPAFSAVPAARQDKHGLRERARGDAAGSRSPAPSSDAASLAG